MIEFVVKVTDLSQLVVLLGATKALGLSPELGIATEERPRRPYRRKGKQSTNQKGKPKRYKSSMSIRLAKAPTDGAPKLQESFRLLHKEFGSSPFRKSLAKGVLAKTMKTRSGLSTYVTDLLDRGNIVAA